MLTIAGTCTLAALFTREMMRRKAEREAEQDKLRADKPALKIPVREEKSSAAPADNTSASSSDLDEQRKKREERKAGSKQSAAQVEAKSAKDQEVTVTAATASNAEPGAEETRARTVLDSSRKIIANYKQPTAYKVDLSLPEATINAAESLIAKGRFTEAWEKAGAVGMQMGMLEIRAGIEKELDDLKSNPSFADKVPAVRATLDEADQLLAEARNRFDAESGTEPTFMSLMQAAMAKTMKAMSEANAIKLNL